MDSCHVNIMTPGEPASADHTIFRIPQQEIVFEH